MAFTYPSCPLPVCPSPYPYLKRVLYINSLVVPWNAHINQSSDPEGCTYQFRDPEGYTYESRDPEECTYQSRDPKGCTYQSRDHERYTYQPRDLEGCSYQFRDPEGYRAYKVYSIVSLVAICISNSHFIVTFPKFSLIVKSSLVNPPDVVFKGASTFEEAKHVVFLKLESWKKSCIFKGASTFEGVLEVGDLEESLYLQKSFNLRRSFNLRGWSTSGVEEACISWENSL
ncbi:NBS-LRR type resistance protein [Cucumis melo var. makuwa]|uniref:NBS-LRR type resistance protein n=1 Tax=Cucumis melo var. makuwa TaxID=1194695 RepID=A0A5D3BMB1_CUCMM|nr:NBS-LRR type resistance protein [Cucumis melo var. makuwa]TYK00317.1 NBS-LRR type resistance protein [Cucumis melo var. makuwa]